MPGSLNAGMLEHARGVTFSYRAVSRIIILAARNITCGKNDRSKMKD